MNIQQLRQSLKQKWLSYYEQNSSWLVKMRVWATYDGLRRPSSGFILATLSVLEPQFDEILAFILDLNNNPDKIIAALGLNFNPDEELRLIKSENQVESQPLQDKLSHENKAVPLVLTATKVVPDSPVKTIHSDLPHLQQTVTSFTDSTELDPIHKPGTLVAVLTKIPPNRSVKALHSVKPDSDLLKEDKPVKLLVDRLPSGGTLTIASQVNSKAKTMPSVPLTAEVSSHSKPVRSLAITMDKPVRSLAISTEVTQYTQYVNTPSQDVKTKVDVIQSTNARSVASWVDEFCQGTRCDREENIFI
ncbi:MAG: DUF5331 domain-containing protein [Nostoc sp. DedQUE01]|nr:DUF5331 domain-containing protein [Nostoc sp. DedQUE11]MDZ8072754.1 DUF5331 domain-containing protein [Nostoc sp. DedQUE01]